MVRPMSPNSLNLDQLEKRHSNVIEEAYNLRQTDASLSDVLYFEAKKIKQIIINAKYMLTKDLDISF